MTGTQPVPSLAEAERFTRRLAVSHYENFLVVSWLLPRRLHQPMFNVYAYCRTVDDLGDEAEGDRLALLDSWEKQLQDCFQGYPTEPIFVALAGTIQHFHLPIQPFRDLIQANRQDQTVARYETYADVEAYCRLSANPVGRLVLQLFGYDDEERFNLSDATCTALQLANFWQDVASDYRERGRIYLPREDMQRFGYSEADLAAGATNDAWRSLMAFEVRRTRALFRRGQQLVPLVERRLRTDLELFSLGGLELLKLIEVSGYDVLSKRPHVAAWRQMALLFRSLISRRTAEGRRRESNGSHLD